MAVFPQELKPGEEHAFAASFPLLPEAPEHSLERLMTVMVAKEHAASGVEYLDGLGELADSEQRDDGGGRLGKLGVQANEIV